MFDTWCWLSDKNWHFYSLVLRCHLDHFPSRVNRDYMMCLFSTLSVVLLAGYLDSHWCEEAELTIRVTWQVAKGSGYGSSVLTRMVCKCAGMVVLWLPGVVGFLGYDALCLVLVLSAYVLSLSVVTAFSSAPSQLKIRFMLSLTR